MQRQFKLIIFFILLSLVSVYAQTIGEQKFLEMKNSFILGLTEKGLEIGAELMSKTEYSDVREEATFYVAEFFFILSTQEKDNTNYPSKAYTYYLVMQREFPNSKYAKLVTKRINTLITYFQDTALFRNLFDITQNEASIVQEKLKFTETLFTFSFPNPYLFFLKGENDISPSEVLNRYYDEIIVNLPEFEIYATYYKIISKLSQFQSTDYVSDGLFKFDIKKISLYPLTGSGNINTSEEMKNKASKLKLSLDGDLNKISIKYLHNPLTLNLHLIFAKLFMNRSGDIIDSQTKQHLEFVVQNELDKTHPRYLLAREFLLDNQFESK